MTRAVNKQCDSQRKGGPRWVPPDVRHGELSGFSGKGRKAPSRPRCASGRCAKTGDRPEQLGGDVFVLKAAKSHQAKRQFCSPSPQKLGARHRRAWSSLRSRPGSDARERSAWLRTEWPRGRRFRRRPWQRTGRGSWRLEGSRRCPLPPVPRVEPRGVDHPGADPGRGPGSVSILLRPLPGCRAPSPGSPVFPELPAGSPQEAGRRARAQGACMCAYRVAPSGHGAEGRRRGRGRDHLCVSVTRSEGRGVWLRNQMLGPA